MPKKHNNRVSINLIFMICCLNPGCKDKNPSCSDETQYCTACGTELILLSNRYRPVRRIGEGGFGVTYLAKDKDMYDDNCVIKQLKRDDLQSKELFEGEAKKLKDLGKNPQIPTLLSYTTDNRYMYLVQECIDGENLAVYLQKKGAFIEREVKNFLNELLPVLVLIHEKKIIHRDIKLDNIMRRKENGQLVLIDFGIAKQLASDTTTNGTIVGTPGYSPSEQMRGKVTPASDLYSLGAACFHLLTEQHPCVAFKEYDYSWTTKWRSYLDKDKKVSNDLVEIIDKLLQEKYELRYQSASDVIEAMGRIEFLPEKNTSKKNLIELITSLINLNSAAIGLIVGIAALFTAGVIKPSKPSTAADYYRKGQELDGGDSNKSIEFYTKAIEINKNYTEAYIGRGIAERDSGNNGNAIKDFEKAIQLNPKSSISYVYRGLTWQDLDESTKAKSDFSKVFTIKPNDATDYHARGLASTNSGDNKEAIEAYDKAISLNPEFRRAYINRGISKQSLGLNRDAINDFTKTISLNDRSNSAFFNRGKSKFTLEDLGGAIEDYDKTIEIKNDSYLAYYHRGIAYEKLKDNQKAINDYTESARIAKEKSDWKAFEEASSKLYQLKLRGDE
jgi:serine/threonine protein kinase